MSKIAAEKFLEFVNASPSAFHAVQTTRRRLMQAGYTELDESAAWKLSRGGRYFYTRNQSTIVAFNVGGKYAPGNGFSIVAAHTDSPNFQVKPNSAKTAQGYLQVGVQTYGGGLWSTWFDRDLTVAGRVVRRTEDGGLKSELVHVQRPLLRIPTLAIHLDRTVRDGWTINPETQLEPVLATAMKSQLDGNSAKKEEGGDANAISNAHHPTLVRVIADELKCDADSIVNFELSVCDTQPAAIGGALNEFIFSPRLDNLMSSFMGLEALVTAEELENDENVRVLFLFDNEEVGSASAHGAGCPIVRELIERVTDDAALHSAAKSPSPPQPHLSKLAIRHSFMISADMAHAVHPNYSAKHEELHRPAMHKGPVIKINANQRYSTTALTAAVILELAKRNNVPVQQFVVRNDSPCGSTIGPIMSTLSGIRTVDIGNPQLSMHSIREMCGTDDVEHGIRLFRAFWAQFAALDAKTNRGEVTSGGGDMSAKITPSKRKAGRAAGGADVASKIGSR